MTCILFPLYIIGLIFIQATSVQQNSKLRIKNTNKKTLVDWYNDCEMIKKETEFYFAKLTEKDYERQCYLEIINEYRHFFGINVSHESNTLCLETNFSLADDPIPDFINKYMSSNIHIEKQTSYVDKQYRNHVKKNIIRLESILTFSIEIIKEYTRRKLYNQFMCTKKNFANHLHKNRNNQYRYNFGNFDYAEISAINCLIKIFFNLEFECLFIFSNQVIIKILTTGKIQLSFHFNSDFPALPKKTMSPLTRKRIFSFITKGKFLLLKINAFEKEYYEYGLESTLLKRFGITEEDLKFLLYIINMIKISISIESRFINYIDLFLSKLLNKKCTRFYEESTAQMKVFKLYNEFELVYALNYMYVFYMYTDYLKFSLFVIYKDAEELSNINNILSTNILYCASVCKIIELINVLLDNLLLKSKNDKLIRDEFKVKVCDTSQHGNSSIKFFYDNIRKLHRLVVHLKSQKILFDSLPVQNSGVLCLNYKKIVLECFKSLFKKKMKQSSNLQKHQIRFLYARMEMKKRKELIQFWHKKYTFEFLKLENDFERLVKYLHNLTDHYNPKLAIIINSITFYTTS
ncbi:hypothetical protein COBT_001878 [Conglomerata obtusa]